MLTLSGRGVACSIDENGLCRLRAGGALQGNGAVSTGTWADAMCPSYKASRAGYSTEGRATLFREWAESRIPWHKTTGVLR